MARILELAEPVKELEQSKGVIGKTPGDVVSENISFIKAVIVYLLGFISLVVTILLVVGIVCLPVYIEYLRSNNRVEDHRCGKESLNQAPLP